MGIALLLKAFYWIGRPGLLKYGVNAVTAYGLSGLSQKSPPSPLYFLWYGGMGVLMIAAVSRLHALPKFAWYFRWASTVGRSSLLVFILQYYVYFTLLAALHLPRTILWPLYFAVTVAFLGVSANAWDRIGGNRWLTLKIWSSPRARTAPKPEDRLSDVPTRPLEHSVSGQHLPERSR